MAPLSMPESASVAIPCQAHFSSFSTEIAPSVKSSGGHLAAFASSPHVCPKADSKHHGYRPQAPSTSKWKPVKWLSSSKVSTLARQKGYPDGARKRETNTRHKNKHTLIFLIPNTTHLRSYDVSIEPDSDLRDIKEYLTKLLKDDQGQEAVTIVVELLHVLRKKNTDLELRIHKFQRQQYRQKSEGFCSKQLDFFLQLLADKNDADAKEAKEFDPAESAITTVAMAAKNYLFLGSQAGGETAAIIYTVLGSCKVIGVNPSAYLRDVFDKLANGWKANQLEELLPKQRQAARDPPVQVAA